jgi:hypothetical protein
MSSSGISESSQATNAAKPARGGPVVRWLLKPTKVHGLFTLVYAVSLIIYIARNPLTRDDVIYIAAGSALTVYFIAGLYLAMKRQYPAEVEKAERQEEAEARDPDQTLWQIIGSTTYPRIWAYVYILAASYSVVETIFNLHF